MYRNKGGPNILKEFLIRAMAPNSSPILDSGMYLVMEDWITGEDKAPKQPKITEANTAPEVVATAISKG
ncbi:hypothetical protein WICPIJ_004142 [Wickerhamomyces pijperi]|uniref:Uncharacterized protein n=1 Tax=Wickerhamomyces pijperi TaxID=599730 RepID=A0A9P8Q8H4_WICPI|nr:hypothetical protein WICPIJ_004142 [Wickerhamomyces pijperi]